jgi:uncharacterized tellurite resistance protein B-like protein
MLQTLKDSLENLLTPQTAAVSARFADSKRPVQRATAVSWQVAPAPGRPPDHDRHTAWRVAHLLHMPQGASVLARQRALENRS